MKEYVFILSGSGTASMANRDRDKFVRLARSESCPGEGWREVVKHVPKPVPGPGQELAYTYTVDGDYAHKEYFLIPEGSVPSSGRSLSKRRLMNALKAAGLWPAVKSYMETNDVWDDFLMATTLDEDDPLVVSAIGALKAGTGLTDAQVEGILASSAVE